MSDTKPALRARLAEQIGDCLASDLNAHIERRAVFVVDVTISLFDAALAIAEDDAETVQYWIECQKLRRPSAKEAQHWKATPDASFRSVVVQPYVLVQKLD